MVPDSLGLEKALRVLIQDFFLDNTIVGRIGYAFRAGSEDLPQLLTQNVYVFFRHTSPANVIRKNNSQVAGTAAEH